ncbi:MAG TPA: serpin family protein [Rhabdochlamydiaceae bacterium]|jgi:serpin B
MKKGVIVSTLALALSPFIAQCDEMTQSAPTQEQITQLIDSHTRFGFSLYPQLDEQNSNLVFSPYSISSCLSMAYVGARDVTEQEMRQALELNLSSKEIAAAYAKLNKILLPAHDKNSSEANKKGYELNLANALWLDQRSYILSTYRSDIETQFGAKVANVSFEQPDSTLALINRWVSDQTRGRIPNLLTRNEITPSTRMLLTNAAYFKGTFTHPFNPKKTHDEPFYTNSTTTPSVKMMEQTQFFGYADNELFQAIALPFVGSSQGKGQIAFVAILPKSPENFDALLGMMPDALNQTLEDLDGQRVHVQLPKFSLSKRYGINDALQKLGMKNPFTTQANFSGIDGLMNLYINQVVHETIFDLDENGVVAAAATAASMNVTSMPPEGPPAEFIADHPFLFFIVDLKSQEVLFIGKFADPNDTL